eukprot:SAG31_NODE_2686_length_5253_cov_84.469926_7_plen_63_part_00
MAAIREERVDLRKVSHKGCNGRRGNGSLGAWVAGEEGEDERWERGVLAEGEVGDWVGETRYF